MKDNTGFVNLEEINYYIKDVRKIPVMTAERELEIKKLMLDPNTSSRMKDKLKEEMITSNLRFVITSIKKYQNQGLSLDDLICEGNVGLIRALETYDWSNENRFTTYSIHWIKAKVVDALNAHSRTIRIPTNVINDTLKEIKNNNNPHFQPRNINLAQSYDEFINDDGDCLLDLLYDPTQKQIDEQLDGENLLRKKLLEVLDDLEERDRDIILTYYGFNGSPLTLEEIGDEYGLTKERIRQIKEKALRRIRGNSKDLFEIIEN